MNYLPKFFLNLIVWFLCLFSLSVHAAAVPAITTSGIPTEQFVGEQFCFSATVSTAGDTGYGPYIQLILKPDFNFSSATLFGAAVNSTYVGTLPANGTDPLSGETVTGPANADFYTLQLPVGSVTPGGAPLNTNICIDVEPNATPNVLQSDAIQVTPVFQFGDSPTGSTAITGTEVSSDITPTIIEYRRAHLTDEVENPTGPTFQYDIELVADIASDRTVSPITFPELNLTNNRQFVGPIESTGGSSCVATVTNSSGQAQSGALPFTPTHMSDSGGTVNVSCSSGSGTAGVDRDVVITIPVYPIDFLDAQSCSFEGISNNRNIGKHVVIRKSASSTSIVPGDTVTFSLSFAVSEYINANNVSITDIMPDGLTYTGVQTMTVQGTSYSIAPVVSNNTPSNGQTTVAYDLSAAYGATFSATTTGVITYTATVDEFYSDNNPLRSSDAITNNVVLNYDIENGATNCFDNSAETLTIIPLVVSKTIINPVAEYQPGQAISFRLRLDIPSGDTKNIVFNDYLPLPALLASGIDTALNLSANTSISYGPNDTLGLTPTSITTNSTSNGLSIQWPEVNSNKAEVIEIDILNQIITTDPFVDDLFLTNVFEQSSTNTANNTRRLYDAVSFTLRSPALSIEKTVSPATFVDAGDTVNYTITVTNDGGANAYDTNVRDVLPSDVSSCSISSQPTGSGDLFSTSGYDLNSLIAPDASVIFNFSCVADTSIEINNVHRNTAYVSWASAVSASRFPEVSDYADFSTAPKQSLKTILSTDKAHTNDLGVGTLTDPRIVSVGETIRYQLATTLPEGTSNSAFLHDYIPAGLQYVAGSAKVALISDGGIGNAFTCVSGSDLEITGSAITTPTCGIDPVAATFVSGTDARFNLGNLVNSDDDANDEFIVIEFDALVMDVAYNQQGTKVYNTFRPSFNGVIFSYSTRPYYSVVEPQLTLATTSTPLSLNAMNLEIDVSNTGSATAFQVTGDDGSPWSITLQNGTKNISNISVSSVGDVFENGTATAITAADFVISGVNNKTLTLLKPLQLDPSAGFTISFDMELFSGIETSLPTIVFEYASQETGGLAGGVRTGVDMSSGSGNAPITDNSTLDDYRVELKANVYSIAGKVYEDIDSSGNYTSGEVGISGVTVVLYNTTKDICRSVKTNAEGEYIFYSVFPDSYQIIESAREVVATPAQCPPLEKDPSGYTSTSSNTISLTVVNSDFDEQNFGDLKGPAFEPNHNGSVLPGNVIFYAHEFTTPANGVVNFTGATSGAVSAGWSYVTYRDSDCDGVLNGLEANASIEGMNLGINGGGRLCIINKVYAPASVAARDKYRVATTAEFTYSNGNTVNLTVDDVTTASSNVSPSTTVTPAVGASRLELRKTVENVSQNTGEAVTPNAAMPGDSLKYRIYYSNTGTGPITDLKVNDSVPDFTSFEATLENCDSTPSGMTCTLVKGLDDSIRWGFTGSLNAGESGNVSFQVIVDSNP